MNWVHYILIYWCASVIITICVRIYNTRRRNEPEKTSLKQWFIIVLAAPFAIAFIPIIPIGDFFNDLYKKRLERKKEEKENKFKSTLGLKPDEDYQCFSRMGGAGIIKCCDCGYQEEIISFVHGAMSCQIGRQCPNCHAFVVEYNESKEYHTFGDTEDDFKCPKCGSIIRKKDEPILKGNDDPLFCPKCNSARLHYHMSYIT